MAIISDILLAAAALGAMFYCIVLSRRLSRFTDLEKGMGGAIAVLSAQVDDMTRMLKSAQGTASNSANSLGELTHRAEDAARRLELLVASMHDLPGEAPQPKHPKMPAEQLQPAKPAPEQPSTEPTAEGSAPLPLTNPVTEEADDADDTAFEPVPIAGLFASSRVETAA